MEDHLNALSKFRTEHYLFFRQMKDQLNFLDQWKTSAIFIKERKPQLKLTATGPELGTAQPSLS